MIRLIDTREERSRFFQICRGSPYGCKLSALAEAYGFSRSFLLLWAGSTAAYGLLDGQLTIAGEPEDIAEAREFMGMLSPGSVLCGSGLAVRLGLTASVSGAVMAKELPGGREMVFPPPGLRDIPPLLMGAGMDIAPEPFYLDLSHRLRHGAAMALGAYREGELIGCAVISAVAGDEALLSAIAVREDCRGMGFGTRLMLDAERALPGRRLYVLRESGRNREFYEKLGFRETGRWSQENTINNTNYISIIER